MKIFVFAASLFLFGSVTFAEVVVELHRSTPYVFNYDTVDYQSGMEIKAPWFQVNAWVSNLTSKNLNIIRIDFLLTSDTTDEQITKTTHFGSSGLDIGSQLTQILPLTVDGLIPNQFIYTVKAYIIGTLHDSKGQPQSFSKEVVFQTQKF
mgnify:CR=1 FL=1